MMLAMRIFTSGVSVFTKYDGARSLKKISNLNKLELFCFAEPWVGEFEVLVQVVQTVQEVSQLSDGDFQ